MKDQQQMSFESPEEMVAKGAELLQSTNLEDVRAARRIFEFFLDSDRNNAGALFSLGVTYMRESRYGMAEMLYRAALEGTPIDKELSSAVYNNLGWVYNSEGRFEEGQKVFRKAIELDPNQPEFYNNMATGFVNMGQPKQCLEWCDKAFEIDSKNRDGLWNSGLAHLELGHWKEGWEGYRGGLTLSINSSQQRKIRHYVEEGKVPYWEGEKGQSVVVYGEQGVGDEILASSVFEDARHDIDIIYEAHPRLVSIMRHNFGDHFPIYGTRKVPWKEITFPQWHKIDSQAPIFNLCQYYRQTDEDFPRKPYLKPFDNLVDKHKSRLEKLGSRPKIGISWKGGTVITRNDLRSVPVKDWEDLLRSVDVDWISLQYDNAEKMGWNTAVALEFQKESGIDLNHDFDVVNDLDECYGGLIHSLDLVISVNNSLVHACGAFGVQCWSLTPSRPAWRYQVPGANSYGDDKMIWYGDHVRQIRQVGDDWDSVLNQVKEELISLYGKRKAA